MATVTTTPAAVQSHAGLFRRSVGDIFLFARVVAGLAIIFAAKDGRPYLHHIGFVVGVAVVTWPVRGVGWATIYDAFITGVLGAYVILGVQWLIEIVILRGISLTFRASVIAPLTEEPLKILPLLLLLFVMRWRGRWSAGACDFMAIGAALGSGFGFVEDSLWRKTSYGDAMGPHLFGVPLIPDARGFIGHGASAGFIGLAIGWGIWMSRRKKLRALAVIPAIYVAVWMMIDHSLWNYSLGSMDRFTAWFWRLDARGRAAPYVFVLAALLTLIAELVVLLGANSTMRRIPLGRAVAYVRAALKKGFGYGELRMAVRRIRGVFSYFLARRQLGYLIAHRRGDAALDSPRYAVAVAAAVGRVLVAQEAITHT